MMISVKNNIRPLSDAAIWYEKVSSGTLSESEMGEFEAWLDEPSHQEEYALCANLWSVSGVPEFWTETEEVSQQKPFPVRKIFPQVRLVHLAGLAATIVFIFGFLFQIWPEKDFVIYETGIGEQRLITLADQSTVLLNTNSLIEVRYSDKSRQIDLLRGEAFFDVEKAPQPFEVKTPYGIFRALGTEFAVRYLSDQHVRLTVKEGKVAVLSVENMYQSGGAMAEAGEMLHLDTAGAPLEKAKVDPENYMSWRKGIVSFSGTPLQDVIEEISRYTELRIVLDAKSISSLKVSGIFHVGQVETFLNGLTEAFPISVEKMGQDIILTEAT